MDAGGAPDGGIFDAPFELAAEEAAALETACYYYMATGCWLAAWPAGFAALAGVGCCISPVFLWWMIRCIISLQKLTCYTIEA